jgi:hypothetical protein
VPANRTEDRNTGAPADHGAPDSILSHAVVGTKQVRSPVAPPHPPPPPSVEALDEDADREVEQPRCTRALGVRALELLAPRPVATTWRARAVDGPQRGKLVALVVVSESANVAARERFARVAEDLQAAGDALIGIQRVHAVAPSRDAFVADLWTTGTARDLSALRWPLRRRLELVCRVAEALESLHGIGLVHGCLCPENVLLDDDLHPVLSEAGLVSVATLQDRGTYGEFAAPEVKSGEAPNARSDIFSAGRLLQELVKGDEIRDVTVAEVIRSCIGPPHSRYPSAGDLGRALSGIAQRLPEVAAAPAPPSRERRVGSASRPEMVVPARTAASTAGMSSHAQPIPVLGFGGLVVVGLAVGGAFFLGGSDASLRTAFAAAATLGAGAATWLLPTLPRAPLLARLALAVGCAALVAVADPLESIYASVAQRHLHGSEGERRAAIDEIIRLGRDFRGLSLAGVDLAGLDLTGADLRGVDLTRADLSRTRLWGAEIEGASFDGARLDGADLDRTNLGQAQIGSASCDSATRLPEGWRCVGARIER